MFQISNSDDCNAAAPTNADYGDHCSQDYIIIAEGSSTNAFGSINFNRYDGYRARENWRPFTKLVKQDKVFSALSVLRMI